MLASGNTVDQIEKAIFVVYRDVLNAGASFIADADPDDPQQHIGALDQFARTFERDLLRQYESDFGRLGWTGITFDQRQSEITSHLATARDRVVGDFKFGMAGGRRMAIRPSVQNNVTFHGPVSGSPVIAPGGTVSQTFNHSDDGVRALADRILSELTATTAAEADARRLAEEAMAELAKQKPDRSAIVKVLMRAGNGLLAIGRTTLAEGTKEIAKGYATPFGLIPPSDE